MTTSVSSAPKYRDPEWLRDRVDEGLTQEEMGDLAGVAQSVISKQLGEHGITSAALPEDQSYRDEEWLREKYHGEGMTTQEMADELGVGCQTICSWLRRHDIRLRRRRIPTADLLGDIERVAEELGGRPTASEYKELGDYGSRTLFNRFGSWVRAADAALGQVDRCEAASNDSPQS